MELKGRLGLGLVPSLYGRNFVLMPTPKDWRNSGIEEVLGQTVGFKKLELVASLHISSVTRLSVFCFLFSRVDEGDTE